MHRSNTYPRASDEFPLIFVAFTGMPNPAHRPKRALMPGTSALHRGYRGGVFIARPWPNSIDRFRVGARSIQLTIDDGPKYRVRYRDLVPRSPSKDTPRKRRHSAGQGLIGFAFSHHIPASLMLVLAVNLTRMPDFFSIALAPRKSTCVR